MILLLALLGCAEEKKFDQFADVFEPALTVNAGELEPHGKRLQVLVHPEREGVCRALPELRADIDGVALTRLHGKVSTGAFKYDRDCFVYEFEGDAALLAKVAGKPTNTVTVTDGVTTVSLTARNLLADTALVVETVEPKAGGEVVLKLSPGDDRVDASVPVSVELRAEGATAVSIPAVATPDTVTFTAPADLTGPFQLDLMGTRAWGPEVTVCTGTQKCSASRTFVAPTLSLELK